METDKLSLWGNVEAPLNEFILLYVNLGSTVKHPESKSILNYIVKNGFTKLSLMGFIFLNVTCVNISTMYKSLPNPKS